MNKISLSFSRFVIMIVIVYLIGLMSFPLWYTFITGDFPGSRVFYGLQEDSWQVDALFDFREGNIK